MQWHERLQSNRISAVVAAQCAWSPWERTIPKCALHPHALQLRDEIKTVADEPSVHWVEYQSRADAISFYRFHPATLRRIRGTSDELDGQAAVRRVQIKDMLEPATFAKYRLRVLRLHYQFVMANERRASYDYFMMICGPLLAKAWTTSPLGLLDFFADARSARFPERRIASRDFARAKIVWCVGVVAGSLSATRTPEGAGAPARLGLLVEGSNACSL